MKPKFTMILMLLALGVQMVFAQQKTISGTVSDENGLPLPGATVIRAGTSSGTTTDFDGKYQLAANVGDVLEISYVGYATQSVTVGASSNYDVQMQPDNTLEEVVVTALGISKSEKAIGYAIQTVDGEKLTEAKETNIVNAVAFYMNGYQAWCEWRRLDYPQLAVPEAAELSSIPVKMPYPLSETQNNSRNLGLVTSTPANMTTKVWWDVN